MAIASNYVGEEMMMNLLRDSIWQFIGVIISLIALLLTLWLYRKQSRRKEILWDITKHTSLSSFNISDKVKVTITFENIRLEDGSLIYLKIWNSGNVEILPEDYNVPIRFSFGKEAKVLDAKILTGVPNNIKDIASIIVNSDSITLKPLLLNSKDSIDLEALLNKFSGSIDDIKVDGRIAGVRQIGRPYENESYIATVGIALINTFASVVGFLSLGIIGFAIFGGIVFLLTSFGKSYVLLNFVLFELQAMTLSYVPSIALYYSLKARLKHRRYISKGRLLKLVPLLIFLILVIGFNILLLIMNPSMNYTPH